MQKYTHANVSGICHSLWSFDLLNDLPVICDMGCFSANKCPSPVVVSIELPVIHWYQVSVHDGYQHHQQMLIHVDSVEI